MRKYENIIKNALIVFFVAMLSVSCLLEKDMPTQDRQSVLIEMSVTGSMTKAAVYEDATESEKVINSLRIYAFYGNRLAGYATRQSTSLGEPFYMDLELPESGKHDVDFYLIANEGQMKSDGAAVQLSENMTREQLEAVKFTGLADSQSLPMYCRQTEEIDVDAVSASANQVEGHEGHFILDRKITFSLSRSLAKLSVYAAKANASADDHEILSVNLLQGGTRLYSYLFPQADTELNAIPSAAADRELLGASVKVGKSVAKGSSDVQDPDKYDAVVVGAYLPEVAYGSSKWDVSSGEDRAAVLHIEYALGGTQQLRNGYVYLPRIERNGHIKVCVLINAEGQISITYQVADWEWEEDAMLDWFFDYPTHSYLRHNLPMIEEDLHQVPTSAPTMSETAPFIGYFQMTYPSNDTWKPTLWGPNSSNCSVKVYMIPTDAPEELVFSSESPTPISVSENWFRIEVYPNVGRFQENDKVKFSITYTPSGLEEAEYLLINGSHGNYYWPGSEDANYVIITMVN